MEQLSPRILQLTREYISQGYGYDLAVKYAKEENEIESAKKAVIQKKNLLTIKGIRDEYEEKRKKRKVMPRKAGRWAGHKCLDHQGNKFKTVSEMCEYWGISIDCYCARKHRKWSLKKILTEPMRPVTQGRPCEDHLGQKFKTQSAMCDHWGISQETFGMRIKAGWSLKRALVLPVKKRKY